MTSSEWFITIATLVFYSLVAVTYLLWVWAPIWFRDKREHPSRAERVALMQRLRKESGYDPSLPWEPK